MSDRLVFGSPEANEILARDKALRDKERLRIQSRERCYNLIRKHGDLDTAITELRRQVRQPGKDEIHDAIDYQERWTDLQTLLAMRRNRNRALRRAAKKAQRP
jgi:hypothetical protein